MKKIYIRTKASSPPSKLQLEWLYRQTYKAIMMEDAATQGKAVCLYRPSVFSLQDRSDSIAPALIADTIEKTPK